MRRESDCSGQSVPAKERPANATRTGEVIPGRPEPGEGPAPNATGSPTSQPNILLPIEELPGDEDAATLATGTADGLRAGGPGGGDGRRSRHAYPDLVTGSIPRKLWRLSWPQVVEGIINVLDQIVDLVWAGRLPGGFRALAGVGVGQSFTQFGMMARQGLDQSARAMISRAVGAGNMPLANHIALQSFTLTGAYSLLMVLVGLLLTDVLLRVIGASVAVQAETAMYMRVQFVGMATVGLRMAGGTALQSAGDVITPLKATTVTRVLHIFITPFMMFGWWWFPTLGLPGAALANVLAQLAGCAINFYALFRGKTYLRLTLRGYRVDYPLLWRLIKIGAPASIAGTERATAQLVLLKFAAPFGDVALAAYSLTRRLEMFANFGSMGIGQASGIMAGQNLGAGRPDRARQTVAWALLYVSMMKGVIGGLLLLFPAAVVMVFTSQADVVALASVWLRIQVIAAIFMGLAMVFQQTFNSAGDTLAPMIVTLLGVWCIELPVAWLLTYTAGVGPLGIGYAAIAGMGSRLALYVPYFFWGRWLRVKVI